MKRHIYIQLVFVFIFLLIVGCNHRIKMIPTIEIAYSYPSPTLEYTLPSPTDLINLTSSSKILDYTPTFNINNEVTSTPIIRSTPIIPTWTPLPTLSSDEANAMVINLLKDNNGCELPCWWGIVPGETSWQIAQQFFSTFAERIEKGPTSTYTKNHTKYLRTTFSIYNKIDDYSDFVSSDYGVTNEIIDIIVVRPRGTELRYQLHQLLNIYGKPEEAQLDLIPNTPEGKPWFTLFLFYQDIGIIAIYDGLAQYHDGKFHICPKLIGPKLILLPPGSHSLLEMKRFAYDSPGRIIPSLDNIPGMSIDSFFEELRVHNACLTIDYE